MTPTKYIILIIFIVGLFLGLNFKGIGGNPSVDTVLQKYNTAGQIFESSQERARYFLAKNIIEKQTLRLDAVAEVALPDVAYKDGHYYSVFAPGVSFLLIPFLYLGLKVGAPVLLAFSAPILATILTSILIFLLGGRLKISPFASFMAALIFPLATSAFSYSVTIYEHAFSALFATSALYFAMRARDGSAWNHLLVWLIYGVSIFVDYPNALLLLPIILYMIIESFQIEEIKGKSIFKIRLQFLYTIVPFLVLVFLLGWYNQVTLGSWFELAHNYRVTAIVGDNIAYNFAIVKSFSQKFVENGLYTLLISKNRGIIFYAPILVFSVFGFLKISPEHRKIGTLVAAIFLLNLLIYASFYDPWGGWSYGPRYLIPSMPLLALFVGIGYDYFKKQSGYLVLFYSTLTASFLVALLGAMTTNLLAPAAEAGKQISFLSLLPALHAKESANLVFNFVSRFRHIQLIEYFLAISSLFFMIILPFFFYQLISNIADSFRRRKAAMPMGLKIQEVKNAN